MNSNLVPITEETEGNENN